jgi:hypothetical protein
MGIVVLLVRAELRRRWRTVVVLGLLVGVVAGAAMWGVAAARRTGSAYERLLAATNAEHLLVNPIDGYADPDALVDQPQVTDSCLAFAAPIAPMGPDGAPNLSVEALTLSSDGRCFYDMSGFARIDGRLPDPDEPYEIFLSTSAAVGLGLGPGDTIPTFFAPFAEQEDAPMLLEDELVVTGVGVHGADAFRDVNDALVFPILMLTPAFREAHPWDPADTFMGALVQLERGADDIAAYNASTLEASGEGMLFEDRFENERKARQALEPYVLALLLFALGVAAAGGTMVLSALHRTLRNSRADDGLLSSLGVRRAHVAAVPAALAAITGLAGTLVAVIGSVAFSSVAPIGPAHSIDPDPGVDADMTVIAVGVGVTLVAVAVVFALATVSRPETALARRGMRERLGALARVRLGLPVPAAAGVRMSTGELGHRRTGARTTLIGAIAGVIAVLVVELVGAGIVRLVDEPTRYGWSWDVLVNIDFEDPAATDEALEASGVVKDRTTVQMGQLDVGGISVAGVGVGESMGQAVLPPLLDGRYATADGEVVLGATTLRRLGADVGDEVPVRWGNTVRDLEVVGVATFPRLAEYPGAPHTGLGEGAMLTADQFTDITNVDYYVAWLTRLRPGADVDDLIAAFGDLPPDDRDFIFVESPQRPDAIFGYDDTAGLRHLLAALLGGIAVVSVTLGIASSTRGAQRDLAVLRTIGLTRKQVRAAVHTHGAVVAGVALLVGVPLGIAAGRWAWRWFADRLGIADDPITPALTIGGLVILALASAVVVSIPLASLASRQTPAKVLRSE